MGMGMGGMGDEGMGMDGMGMGMEGLGEMDLDLERDVDEGMIGGGGPWRKSGSLYDGEEGEEGEE